MEPAVGGVLGSNLTNLAWRLAVPERLPLGVVDIAGVIVTLVKLLLAPSRILFAAPPPDGTAESSIPILLAGSGPFNFKLPVDLSILGLFGLNAIETVSLLQIVASPEMVRVNGKAVLPLAGTSLGCSVPKSTVLKPCASPSMRQVLVPMLPVNEICPEFVVAALDWLARIPAVRSSDIFTIFFMRNSLNIDGSTLMLLVCFTQKKYRFL
jgi:hypothetical protein